MAGLGFVHQLNVAVKVDLANLKWLE